MKLRIFALLCCVVSAFFSSALHAESNYAKQFKGKRLIMEDSQCAGIEFSKDAKTALMYNEMGCESLETNLRWLDNATFSLSELNSETNSVRYWVYHVENQEGNQITLKEFWLGWGELDDTSMTYTLKKN